MTVNEISNYYVASIVPRIKANQIILNRNTNFYLVSLTTNGLLDIQRVEQVGQSAITVTIHNIFGTEESSAGSTNIDKAIAPQYQQLIDEIKGLHDRVAAHNTPLNAALYSIGFYIMIFIVNALMFIGSMAFCRTILREIAKSGRLATIGALVFTNFVAIFVCGAGLLLVLTVVAIPLFWLLIPFVWQIGEHSFYAVCALVSSAALALLVYVGNTTRVMGLIALLPGFVALATGVFTWFAVRWRGGFHSIAGWILQRCAEKNPFLFFGGLLGFVEAVVVLVNKYLL